MPPRLRDKIKQARERGFPEGYQKMLRDYYRRLAKGTDAAKAPVDKPATKKPQAESAKPKAPKGR